MHVSVHVHACMCVYVCFCLCVHVIKNTMSQQGMVCSAVTEIALCSSPSLIQSTNPLATGAAKLDFKSSYNSATCKGHISLDFSIQVKMFCCRCSLVKGG